MSKTSDAAEMDDVMLKLFGDELFSNGFERWQEPESWLDKRLVTAIRRRAYPTIYALLRRQERQFFPDEAFQLCMLALDAGLNRRAFSAVLDHSPPLCRFQHRDGCGLVERAAGEDRADILDLLLERGGNLGRYRRHPSPLEAAMEGQALHSLERLLREPELDVTLTPRLLNWWSLVDSGMVMLDFCLQAAAPRLLGKEPTLQDPYPVPDQLTVVHAVRAGNWQLMSRLCRERGTVSLKEGRRALECFPTQAAEPLGEDITELVRLIMALDALLTACPQLLRGQRACQLLVRYVLRYHEVTELVGRILGPWIEKIKGRKVPLRDFPDTTGRENFIRTLRLWLECFPDGPIPAVDRHTCIHEFLVEETTPEELELIFRNCAMLRRRLDPRRIISNLALSLLLYGTPAQVEEQLRPGGLLDGEDPEALLRFCKNEEHPRLNRMVLLAYVKKEVDYEL